MPTLLTFLAHLHYPRSPRTLTFARTYTVPGVHEHCPHANLYLAPGLRNSPLACIYAVSGACAHASRTSCASKPRLARTYTIYLSRMHLTAQSYSKHITYTFPCGHEIHSLRAHTTPPVAIHITPRPHIYTRPRTPSFVRTSIIYRAGSHFGSVQNGPSHTYPDMLEPNGYCAVPGGAGASNVLCKRKDYLCKRMDFLVRGHSWVATDMHETPVHSPRRKAFVVFISSQGPKRVICLPLGHL